VLQKFPNDNYNILSQLKLTGSYIYQLTNKICFTPRSGFQSFLSVLTQISPLLATFGWKILVKKNPEKHNITLLFNFMTGTFLLKH